MSTQKLNAALFVFSPKNHYQTVHGRVFATHLVDQKPFNDLLSACMAQLAITVAPDPFACHKLQGAKLLIETMLSMARPDTTPTVQDPGVLEPLEPIPGTGTTTPQ